MFRSVARWFVVAVLALDAVAAFVFIGGSLLETHATTQPAAVAETTTLAPATVSTPAPAATPTPAPAEAKPAPLATDLLPSTPAETIPGAMNPETPVAVAKHSVKGAPKSEAFLRLLHAYENMEPESAAKAIAVLAAKDNECVVQLLLGWKPRTSGQILDALTQLNPGLAAELSYEVWKRSGEAAS